MNQIRESVHLVGIGGEGMSALAHYLLDKGHAVSGSDLRRTPETERLSARGARIFEGHRPDNVGDARMLIFSDAISKENIEISEARLREISVVRRAAFLGLLARDKRSILVAGSHGKSTTSAMIVQVLRTAGRSPGFVIGAGAECLDKRRAFYSPSELLVVEACEAFNNLAPLAADVAVVTNIDDDHLEHYGSQDRLDLAFKDFLGRVKPGGIAFLNGDDAGVRRILGDVGASTSTFGFDLDNDICALEFKTDGLGSTLCLSTPNAGVARLRLRLPGEHVARNALAAVAVCLHLGIPFDDVARGITGFTGVDRRWRDHGDVGGVRLVEDFAHHPTEIAAAISTARAVMISGQRLLVAFQPQLYSRTKRLHVQFAERLAGADHALLLDIDPAGEREDRGVSVDLIAESMRRMNVRVDILGDVDELVSRWREFTRPGDFLLVMGAGSIQMACERMKAEGEASRPEPANKRTPARLMKLGTSVQSGIHRIIGRVRGGERPAAGTTKTIVELFHKNAREFPAATAVSGRGISINYRDLNALADKCVRFLNDHGVEKGTVVAVGLCSSVELVVTVVALAKAGAVYMPLAAALPVDRARYMLEVSKCEFAILDGSAFKDGISAKVIAAAAITEIVAKGKAAKLTGLYANAPGPSGPGPEDLAYICFTSGSTGKPKGVLISHESLAAFVAEGVTRFDIGPDVRMALNTAIGFDVSVGEIWLTLGGAGCLCVTESRSPLVGSRLADFLERTAISHLAITPSVLRSVPERAFHDLRCIIAAGEACGSDLVERWAKGRSFFNAYGPTEATVYATVARCSPGKPITIGTALGHVTAHVLDAEMHPMPTLEIGELYLGGAGVAQGYLGGSTAENNRFRIRETELGVERLYQTGDFVCIDDTGELVFHGRRDRQIKILANRVELDEVEATITTHPSVRDAAVCLREDDGPPELVAFVAPVTSAVVDPIQIRDEIGRWLPSYMLPGRFVVVDEIACNENGKKDRARLLAILAENEPHRPFYSAGRTDVEARLARVWSNVLRRGKDIGVYDDFESLRGDSLKSLELIAAVEDEFDLVIPPGYFERFTNVVNMAPKIEELLWARDRTSQVEEGFRGSRIYYQQRHLVAGWSGSQVEEGGLIRSLGDENAVFDLFLCVQYQEETLNLHKSLGPDFRVHGMRSGHLVMNYTEENVELLTNHYLEELEKIDPRGRLLIGGVCQGGTVAFALARKLQQRRRPELLILIEQSKLPAYNWPLAFFYSRESFLNPAKRFEDGEGGFRSAYGDHYSLDLIDGEHGNFHREPQVNQLVDCLRRRLRTLP